MITPTDGSTIFAATRNVGSALYKNASLRASVAASTKSLFTLKPYSASLITPEATGGYKLNALRFEDNEIKVFKLSPTPPALKATQGTSLSLSPNPCRLTGTNKTCSMEATFKNESGLHQQVWVKLDGKETLMMCSKVNITRPISWIVPDKQYVFTVYTATSCEAADRKSVLESVSAYGLKA